LLELSFHGAMKTLPLPPMRAAISMTAAGLLLFLADSSHAARLQVGPGKTYAAPCAAFAAAQAGDTVEIDSAGSYHGDVCSFRVDNLTIRGVGASAARAVIDATGVTIPNQKAIWVIQGNDTTIENVEMSGAQVPDMNGAGIRQEGNNLTLRNCYFHDNQDGILTNNGASQILIDRSEFAHNGAGDGFSHNMYIGAVDKFTLQSSYSHGAVAGHEVKTRARENHILYNRIMDEANGSGSYQINLAQAGTTYVIGNLIQKGPLSQNHGAYILYECQGGCSPTLDLYVVNNTIVNDVGPAGTFVSITAAGALPALIRNNIFLGAGTVTDQAAAMMDHNYTGASPMLADRAQYDYHLVAGSPCIDQGAAPGASTEGVALTPAFQYVHPASSEPRMIVGPMIDIGAYEYGNVATAADAAVTSDGSSTDGTADAGAQLDASSASDAAPSADAAAGVDAGQGGGAKSSGCSCDAARAQNGAGAFSLLVAVMAWVLRVRRRARTSGLRPR
jgi:MYXO-CTERM domain-containing protein